jgi:hypothetical protein
MEQRRVDNNMRWCSNGDAVGEHRAGKIGIEQGDDAANSDNA